MLVVLAIFTLDFLGIEGIWAVILGFIAFFGSIIIHGLYIERFYHIIQTYLYVTVNLGTEISMQDARYLMLLFAPSDLGHWYPMKGIKELPKEIRRQALLDSAARIYQELGVSPSAPKDWENKNDFKAKDSPNSEIFMEAFSDLVSMLCKLAKADNYISKEEINIIDSFFNDILNLSTIQRREAINYFNRAKISDTPFEVHAQRFFQCHRNNEELLESVCTLLTNLALADGELSAEEEILINQAISIFGVFGQAYREFRNAYRFNEQVDEINKEKKYAKILGLNDEITYENIRKTYYSLAHKYHPDKVAHLGDKMRTVAEEKMKIINEAYEYLTLKYSN